VRKREKAGDEMKLQEESQYFNALLKCLPQIENFLNLIFI